MPQRIAAIVTSHIEDISRRWVEALRQTSRTEVHKTMLTAEIVSGTKAIMANLAEALELEGLDARDTAVLIEPQLGRGTQGTRPLSGPRERAQAAAALHGKLRHEQGFQVHELAFELTMLRNTLLDVLDARGPEAGLSASFNLLRRVSDMFDEVIVHAIDSYYEASVRDLEKRAIRDPMTQLYNKEYFRQRLHEELRRALRYSQPVALALVDMDHLKQINDTHGHQVGDAVIVALGRTLAHTCRQADVACRYGGDEFAVILPETGKAQAYVFGERLLKAVQQMRVVVSVDSATVSASETNKATEGSSALDARGSGAPLELSAPTVSVGIAAFPEDGRNPETLLSRADAALYRAKRRGRNMISS